MTNYVEPFAGSLAVLLNRPYPPRIETVNDADAFLSNFWRALQAAPDDVAAWCNRPVNEADQHAIHAWLVAQRGEFTARVMGDPDYYDAKIAGRWVYGLCCWIGSGWCSGRGTWQSIDGQLVHLGDAGRGIHRQRVHLGTAGQGIHRQLVHLGTAGQGESGVLEYFYALADRLRYVRVCCGDWTRVLGPSVTYKHGLTGVILDPPYSADEDRTADLYAIDDDSIAHAVREWCCTNGAHPLLRIALCGYGDVHDALLTHGWIKESWTTNGGFSNQRKHGTNPNKYREVIYFSPACLPPPQPTLFDMQGARP